MNLNSLKPDIAVSLYYLQTYALTTNDRIKINHLEVIYEKHNYSRHARLSIPKI